MAKTTSKPVPRKSSGGGGKANVRHSGQQAVRTQYVKPPSTTNYGTRPPVSPPKVARSLPPTTIYGRPAANVAAPAPTAQSAARQVSKQTAAPIVRTPAPVVNRAAALASNIAKQAASQQIHRAATRAVNHPAEVGGGGNTGGGGGYNTGGGGGGNPPTVSPPVVATPTTPTVTTPAPPIVSPTNPNGPTNVRTFTSTGRPGTYGAFQRQRLNRGPRTGLSVTPEMLRRIAAQRIGPT